MKGLGLSNIVLFGHSMGTDLALELYEYIRQEASIMPVSVILSGNRPPHIHDNYKWSSATDHDLLEHVVAFGGIPKEAIADVEFVSMYLDKIKSDYLLYESINIDQPLVVNSRLTVVYGDADPLLEGIDMTEWSKYSSKDMSLHKVVGGHFYFQKDHESLLSVIRGELQSEANSHHITSAFKNDAWRRL